MTDPTLSALAEHRPLLARDGIFNVRDLGGLPTANGARIAPRRLLRGDSLHRARASVEALRSHDVVRVLDLRDERERTLDGVLDCEGIDVVHLPVLDPTFEWEDATVAAPDQVLARRYELILESFPERFAGAVTSIAEVVTAPSGAVAYHCAVGKDRTGLLSALLLGMLGSADDVIVEDYARSAAAGAVQVSWLWSIGHVAGDVSEEELAVGVWSARPDTMRATLAWLEERHGGAGGYLRDAGVPAETLTALAEAVLVTPGSPAPG